MKILQKVQICPVRCTSESFRGGFAPLIRGSAPGPRWGLRPQTPVIGSRSTRSPCASPKKLPMPPLFQYSGAGAAKI